MSEGLTLLTHFFSSDPMSADAPGAAAHLVLDLIGPRAERAGLNGFALLWRDRSPHEQAHWRLSLAADGDVSELTATIGKRLGAPDRIEVDDWITARQLLRKRAEPARLIGFGRVARATTDLLNRHDARAVYLPLALSGDRNDPMITLPVIERVFSAEEPAATGLGLAECLELGVACGRVMLAAGWQQTTCAEKTDYFLPMRHWHLAWLSNALIRVMEAWPGHTGTSAPWPDGFGGDPAAYVSDTLSPWIAETVIGPDHPAHRNAFLAGLSHAAWLDEELQEYLEPEQRQEVFASLLPYFRWFSAMGLFNHLGPDLDADTHRDQWYAALVEAVPEFSALSGLTTHRDIEQALIRVPADRAAAAFAELLVPFCDVMVRRIHVNAE